MFLEQFLKGFLLLFVLRLELIELFGQFLVPELELFVSRLDLRNLFLFYTDLALDFLLVLFLFAREL